MDPRLTTLVDNIIAGNDEAKTVFTDLMDDRAADAIEVVKTQVAASIFSAPEPQEN